MATKIIATLLLLAFACFVSGQTVPADALHILNAAMWLLAGFSICKIWR